MKRNHNKSGLHLKIGGASILMAGLVACSPTVAQMPSTTSYGTPIYVTPVSSKKEKDSIVGKWDVFPAIGPTKRSCTMDFKASSFGGGKGSVSTFACNQVEGLGGLNGVSRITKWERKGSTIILSGIASPNIGSIELSANSFQDRVPGSTKDDVRFIIVRR
ncbi:hypothetical protein [Roseibium sediminicola]|uniref:Protease inhibitor Inh n=1 Tax=Roseibium sediminicola TaxID=2933272 RepID=A0ABT0GS39_9HYPH|nr:hypothetical protein [Roseibium sp. CAU 1639]MCK7612262.1 hypothetical protein [Roseibium sp. CAU 1639]